MIKIKDLPSEVQPREKAIKYGIDSLSNTELIALIIASGFKGVNVLFIASNLINEFGGLSHLSNANLQSLKAIKGIKKTKALKLLAVFEIHKRLLNSEPVYLKENPYDYIRQKYVNLLRNEEQEYLYILILNRKRELICEKLISSGDDYKININIDILMKFVIIHKGKSCILVHNHPSGNLSPSNDDLDFTTKLIFKFNLMNINLLEHYIVAGNRLISILNILKNK